MTARGFTLVELLIATMVSLLVSGAALVLARGARTAFAVEPAALDTVRRLRDGADTLAAAIAGAGGELDVGDVTQSLLSSVPAVQLTAASGGGAFTELIATRVVQGGRGRLAWDQPGPSGSLTLDTSDGRCPRSGSLCGFDAGDVAVIFDGRGHFDVLIVAAITEPLARLSPRAPLSHAYRAGAWIVAVRRDHVFLTIGPDGARTLTRATAAGAREPIVDGVTELQFEVWGDPAPPALQSSSIGAGFARYGLAPPGVAELDPEGIFPDGSHCLATYDGVTLASTLVSRSFEDDGLVRLGPSDFDDGPWCPHDDAAARFDADWFRVRRIDVVLGVEALADEFRGARGVLFARGGTAVHDAPRWIRDRGIRFSVAVVP